MEYSLNKEAIEYCLTATPEQRRYLCSKYFPAFMVYYFTEYIKFGFAPFHFEMFNDIESLMENKYREVAWLAFRESAKTSIAKIYVMWLIVYKKRRYINVDSFDKENAERILFDVVISLQTNKKLKFDFGEIFNSKRNPEEASQKRINNFVTNNGVRVEAHSTQESVRGRLHGNQRPDFLLLDDFETNKTKDSKAYTEQVISHINEFKAGLDSTAIVLYLGNYITELGSVQSLIDRAKTDDRLKIRLIPVIKDGKPTWPDKYVMTDAELLEFPNKISLEDKKKQLGSMVFSAEMMNEPIDEASQKFFKAWFKYKKKEDVLALRTRKFATIDTAMSKGADSDFTGITKNYVDVDNNWYISARGYKIGPKELINIIFQLHDEGFEKIGIEKTAYTEGIEPFMQDEMRVRNKYPYVVQLNHGGIMKETRIEGMTPKYEAGQVFHIEGECEELEEQLLRFPMGVHDDVIDSCFVGETMVSTLFGDKMIKDVKVGDYVLTPSGINKVVWSGQTGIKEVITNIGLTATKDHKIFNGNSFDNLDTLDYNSNISKLSFLNLLLWRYKKELHLMVENTNLWEGKESIILANQIQPAGGKILKDFMLRFGNLIMERKLKKATVFIIKMVTALIMTSLIWSAYKVGNIYQNTLRIAGKMMNIGRNTKEYLKISDLSQKNGTSQKQVCFGIKNMLKALFMVKKLREFAKSVERSIKPELSQQQNTALEDVTVEAMLENGERDTQTITERKVYNITVEYDHVYYAGGLLVANCAYQLKIAEAPFPESKQVYREPELLYSDIGL